MTKNYFKDKVIGLWNEGKRMVAPLVGFPGLNITNSTIKIAQQNYDEHFKVIKAIADSFEPDIIFPLMDLSVEANALGRYTIFPITNSPTVVRDNFSMSDLDRGKQINVSYDMRLLGYVETLKMMSVGLSDSIIKGAYVTGPFSLAALIMGADDAVMATISQRNDLHKLCQLATEKIQEYIRLLIAAGAQVICILEPSSVMLGPEQFSEFSANYIKYIVECCQCNGIPIIYHICGNAMHLVDKMVEAGVDALSLDSPNAGIDLPAVAKKLTSEVVIIGNIDPTGTILHGSPDNVKAEVNDLLNRMESYPNFILSTGCDLPQETPLENIRAFMQAGRQYRKNQLISYGT